MNGGSLRWGLLAASGIARKFARDLKSRGIDVAAVASRDADRAKRFAAELEIPRSHGSYQALLDDPHVDVIYVSLPNHLHAEWSIRAAQAGKHVLCEKPGALDESECEMVLRAAQKAKVFYMEGFMYRCHPLWGLVEALIEDGRIGKIQSLHSAFCYDMGFKPANIRQSRAAAGGALLDVGCYCLSFSRLIAHAEPKVCRAETRIGAETGVDEWTKASLEFPGGLRATFECAIRQAQPHAAVIHGDCGHIEIASPWHPSRDNAQVRLCLNGAEPEVYGTGDGLPLFAREALDVAENLGNGQSPSMTWEDSLGQARALEALRKSAGLI